jgi:nucleotide-binding universal stress UspA family protein
MVALDASPRNMGMIKTAARLASRLRAELIGLFVEDIDLLRIAELPFANEIGLFSQASRRLDVRRLERDFRAQANWMRRVMAEIAENEKVQWDFRVARGPIAPELLAAGAEVDLLILGKVGRSLRQRRRIGSTVKKLLLRRPGLTMVLSETRSFAAPAPVVTIYDGSKESQKALEAAGRLVESEGMPLHIIVLADDENVAQKLEVEVEKKVHLEGLAAKVRRMINPSLEKLAMAVRMDRFSPLIVPCGRKHVLEGDALCSLVNEVANPVLVVR